MHAPFSLFAASPARHHDRRSPRLALLFAAAVGLALAACGTTATPVPSPTAGPGGCTAAPAPPANQEGWTSAPSEPTVLPVIVNSGGSLTCGENRLLFTFLDAEDRTVASPDRTVLVSIYDLGRDGATPTQERIEGTFVWGIENERGFYVANVTFAEAGVWGVEFETAVGDSPPEKVRVRFDVAISSPVVRVGQPAPASDTPTAASVGGDLAKVSTDDHPDPAFYKVSVKDAVAAKEPFVLVFATPKFCVSAQCGPTLDVVKPLAAEFPSVHFINVEPYQMTFADGELQAVRNADGSLVPVAAVNDWGILSEPWVFVVDGEGIVRASFEGVISVDELRAAVAAVK